jgi:hypothetical protein
MRIANTIARRTVQPNLPVTHAHERSPRTATCLPPRRHRILSRDEREHRPVCIKSESLADRASRCPSSRLGAVRSAAVLWCPPVLTGLGVLDDDTLPDGNAFPRPVLVLALQTTPRPGRA